MSRKSKIDRRGAPKKDLPDLYKWPLHPKYWDFRDVPPEEVKVATFYEYAASCDWIRLLWDHWLRWRFPLWKVVRGEVKFHDSRTQTVFDVLEAVCQNGIPTLSFQNEDVVARRLITTIPEQLQNSAFKAILFTVPKFPTAWTKLDPQSKLRLKLWLDWQLRAPPALSVIDPSHFCAGYLQGFRGTDRFYEFVVDWSRPEKEMLELFELWLKAAYGKFGKPPEAKGKQGMGSSDGYEKLRWLTAWRLDRSGLKHIRAQEVLKERNAKPHSKYVDHDLPLAPRAGTWRNFHARARKACQQFFPYPPDNLSRSPSRK